MRGLCQIAAFVFLSSVFNANHPPEELTGRNFITPLPHKAKCINQ